HSPSPRLLAGVWCVLRETMIAAGNISRADKEAIATGVSQANECPYCVEVHNTMLGGAGVAASPKLLVWASHTLSPDTPAARQPPFRRENAAEIIGTAVTFHYVNRMVNIFLGDSPVPLPRGLGWLRGLAGRVGTATFARRIVALAPTPGRSLPLLP